MAYRPSYQTINDLSLIHSVAFTWHWGSGQAFKLRPVWGHVVVTVSAANYSHKLCVEPLWPETSFYLNMCALIFIYFIQKEYL